MGRSEKRFLGNMKNNPETRKKYRLAHRKEISDYRKQWYIDNPEYYRQQEIKRKAKQYLRQWRKDNPKKAKEHNKKAKYQRRHLGFFPLNEYFEGSHAHHISQNFVIYIPEEIHKSIWHCLQTGKNMEQINKLAIEFL